MGRRPTGAELKQWYDSGWSVRRIAVETGAGYGSIRRWLKAAGVAVRKPGGKAGKRRGTAWIPALELFALSARFLARKYQVSEQVVYKRRARVVREAEEE